MTMGPECLLLFSSLTSFRRTSVSLTDNYMFFGPMTHQRVGRRKTGFVRKLMKNRENALDDSESGGMR